MLISIPAPPPLPPSSPSLAVINWANTRLGGEEHLYELTDLADGVLIVRLVEALTARTVTDAVDVGVWAAM